ncbi:MAG: carboxymuconolactone decarboxylase family protein [Pseudonocardiaceae bacterium]
MNRNAGRYRLPTPPDGLVAEVYRQIRRDFGALVEPMAVHAAVPTLLAAVWCVNRETLLVGRVRRELKEAVATVVSQLNRCPYCVDAHTIMLHAGSQHRTARLLSRGDYRGLGDPELAAVVGWAASTRSPDAAVLTSPPFDPADAPELIGTAVAFHYINRIVTILLGDSPVPGPSRVLGQSRMREAAKRPAALWFSRAVRRPKNPGAALALLPAAPIPTDLGWATASPFVAGAFARFVRAVTEAGEQALDADTRLCVSERIEAWRGEPVGLDQAWVDDAVRPLRPQTRPLARLALLTALDPHRIDQGTVEAMRADLGDGRLISVLAWSSSSAARRIATWLS